MTEKLDADAQTMASLLQGALVVQAAQFVGVDWGLVKQPARVEQPQDENDDWARFFRVHLASGIVLRVTVEPEQIQSEQDDPEQDSMA